MKTSYYRSHFPARLEPDLMFVARPSSTIALWIGILVIVIVAGSSVSGCGKKEETSSNSTSSSDSSESAGKYVPPKQADGVTRIENLDALPKLDNGGKLLAAVRCQPEGFESRQGVAALF